MQSGQYGFVIKMDTKQGREKTYDQCCQENALATMGEMQMLHKSGVQEMREQIPGERERDNLNVHE